jgi:hypothetical protein
VNNSYYREADDDDLADERQQMEGRAKQQL